MSRAERMPINIFWFRRDLRLEDNRGLAEAMEAGSPVLPLFIFDRDILDVLEDRSDRRVEFIFNAVKGLNAKLRADGSSLHVEHGTPIEVFAGLLKKFDVRGVYVNHDFEPKALERDRAVGALLAAGGVEFKTFKDQVIFEKREVAKDDGEPYTVFTPFSRKWKARLEADPSVLRPCEVDGRNFVKRSGRESLSVENLSLERMGFRATGSAFPSPEIDLETIRRYERERNFPALNGTSRLGVHLRFGTVSVRELVRTALRGSDIWLNELIWREFFMQILWNFPHVASGPFRPEYERIQWRNDRADFEKWCEGSTGYPIVDAGMRELNETGFMHNRARMIAASFLVKHLLIDWRWGEAYFARKLLDFELASNNGNWQWVAGCGCDSAPYFRVFNPDLQQKKFDPRQEYVRRWIPELGTKKYSEPIVDHVTARVRALKAYNIGLGKKAPKAER